MTGEVHTWDHWRCLKVIPCEELKFVSCCVNSLTVGDSEGVVVGDVDGDVVGG